MQYDGFLTLQCRLEPLGGDRFRATTQGQARGAQSVDFVLPDTAAMVARFQAPFRTDQPDRLRFLQTFGTTLFELIFQGETLSTWRVLHFQARAEQKLLRLVLDVTAPALQQLPWETLYDSGEYFFLARDSHTCLLRFPRDPEQPAPDMPRLPLRILAMIAAPHGAVGLDVEAERQRLAQTLLPLTTRGEVHLAWIDGRQEAATLGRLADELTRAADAGRPYDVLHFVGHAGWREVGREGALLLEDGQRNPALATAAMLGDLLRRGQLRLAVLNACEGSRADQSAPFSSVAASLLRGADLSAVVANQIEVSDRAAQAFAAAFYEALAARLTVEEGVVAARDAVALADARRPEWVATIFFSRLAEQPIRLLPAPDLAPVVVSPRAGHPLLTAAALCAVTALMGVVVISFFRAYGLLVSAVVQLAAWAIAAWFAYDRRDHIRQFRTYVAAALAVATALVALWFVYQPTLQATPPPRDFALALDFPSPYALHDDQIAQVAFSVDVQGIAYNVPEGHHVWILVQAENSATYVPGAEALVNDQDQFVAPEVIVGPPVSRPVGNRRYTLQPVLVNEAGHGFLLRHASPFWRFFHPDIRVSPQPRLQNALVVRR